MDASTAHPERKGRLLNNQLINPAHMATPSGFSHGVLAGNVLHLGGQTAMDKTGSIVPGDIVAQFRQCFTNVLDTVAEAGGTPEDLVSVTIYLTDVEDYQKNGREIGRVWRELAGTRYPAMTGLGVTKLWQPEALIEIAGIAVIPTAAA